ncbi:hypothetical protein GCM10011340_32190 [Roseivirga thermotolerans]|uniref:Uncharacterized protein n=1 Tax=Roseivirga thermotolerans TaxID=1758176 RepID=A0ABQ3ICA1_9BACT|nr:hypothetical protein GCM10011340_32190 [Roseivirga thermotolerans]
MKRFFKKLAGAALKQAVLVAVISVLEYALDELKEYKSDPKKYENDQTQNLPSNTSDKEPALSTV